MVIHQRLEERGFDGGMTIVRDSLSRVRQTLNTKPPSSALNPTRVCNVRWTGAPSAPSPTAIPSANSTASP
jgi:hypothetical protein